MADFDTDETARLTEFVDEVTAKGAAVLLDPHNYARYDGDLIGTDIEAEALGDFWARLATAFKDNEAVLFGLMNEPHDMETETWLDAANVAIAAIREAGADNLILCPETAGPAPTAGSRTTTAPPTPR
jgi:endoglucanase